MCPESDLLIQAPKVKVIDQQMAHWETFGWHEQFSDVVGVCVWNRLKEDVLTPPADLKVEAHDGC